jgi:FAD-linked oxidoreductase
MNLSARARGWWGGGEWANWARDQVCSPARIVSPRDRDELAAAIAAAASDGGKIAVAGSGHSFTEAAMTEGTMLRIEALRGVLDADGASGLVRVGAGTRLADLNEELAGLGLAMENLGDIDRQTLAGAISTGTHGTGARLRNLSAQVEGLELVLADGGIRQLSAATDPELLCAARVGVGALGAISAVTLRCVPAFTLRRVDSPRPREEVLDSFQELADANDHFELFTFPYAESALVLERNRVEGPPRPRGRLAAFFNNVVFENWALEAFSAAGKLFPAAIPALSRLAARLASGSSTTDRSDRVFVNERRVRFTEMEYGLPREHGPEAARRVIEWVRSNRYPVFFPIEMRVTAADDASLSPSHGRDTAYVAVHQYHGMEWRPYFEAVEEIMDSYGGRPHWGKRHFQTAATLAPRYPAWSEFQRARDALDPERVFTNAYAARVLGP